MERFHWADRGQLLQLDSPEDSVQACAVGVSRLGSAQLAGSLFSIWVQLRGSSWVEAREGRFRLRRGDWIALEKDSRPGLQADRHGFCIGLSLNTEAVRVLGRFNEDAIYAGRGRMGMGDSRVALRLWREAASRLEMDTAADPNALRPLLLHIASVQSGLLARIPRCPGRSRSRKRHVFGRLQRARLFLEGNRDRVVRNSELADLTSFSSWYFSKTFHSVYEESPQAASMRIRMEHAADLLRDTEMMIGEVAAASGFDNCCSFARAFRSRYGTSASLYRAAAIAPRTDSANPSSATRKAVASAGT